MTELTRIVVFFEDMSLARFDVSKDDQVHTVLLKIAQELDLVHIAQFSLRKISKRLDVVNKGPDLFFLDPAQRMRKYLMDDENKFFFSRRLFVSEPEDCRDDPALLYYSYFHERYWHWSGPSPGIFSSGTGDMGFLSRIVALDALVWLEGTPIDRTKKFHRFIERLTKAYLKGRKHKKMTEVVDLVYKIYCEKQGKDMLDFQCEYLRTIQDRYDKLDSRLAHRCQVFPCEDVATGSMFVIGVTKDYLSFFHPTTLVEVMRKPITQMSRFCLIPGVNGLLLHWKSGQVDRFKSYYAKSILLLLRDYKCLTLITSGNSPCDALEIVIASICEASKKEQEMHFLKDGEFSDEFVREDDIDVFLARSYWPSELPAWVSDVQTYGGEYTTKVKRNHHRRLSMELRKRGKTFAGGQAPFLRESDGDDDDDDRLGLPEDSSGYHTDDEERRVTREKPKTEMQRVPQEADGKASSLSVPSSSPSSSSSSSSSPPPPPPPEVVIAVAEDKRVEMGHEKEDALRPEQVKEEEKQGGKDEDSATGIAGSDHANISVEQCSDKDVCESKEIASDPPMSDEEIIDEKKEGEKEPNGLEDDWVLVERSSEGGQRTEELDELENGNKEMGQKKDTKEEMNETTTTVEIPEEPQSVENDDADDGVEKVPDIGREKEGEIEKEKEKEKGIEITTSGSTEPSKSLVESGNEEVIDSSTCASSSSSPSSNVASSPKATSDAHAESSPSSAQNIVPPSSSSFKKGHVHELSSKFEKMLFGSSTSPRSSVGHRGSKHWKRGVSMSPGDSEAARVELERKLKDRRSRIDSEKDS